MNIPQFLSQSSAPSTSHEDDAANYLKKNVLVSYDALKPDQLSRVEPKKSAVAEFKKRPRTLSTNIVLTLTAGEVSDWKGLSCCGNMNETPTNESVKEFDPEIITDEMDAIGEPDHSTKNGTDEDSSCRGIDCRDLSIGRTAPDEFSTSKSFVSDEVGEIIFDEEDFQLFESDDEENQSCGNECINEQTIFPPTNNSPSQRDKYSDALKHATNLTTALLQSLEIMNSVLPTEADVRGNFDRDNGVKTDTIPRQGSIIPTIGTTSPHANADKVVGVCGPSSEPSFELTPDPVPVDLLTALALPSSPDQQDIQQRNSQTHPAQDHFNAVHSEVSVPSDHPKRIPSTLHSQVSCPDVPIFQQTHSKKMMSSFSKTMFKSELSQRSLQQWDKKMGLKRSHSSTMTRSTQSRKQVRDMLKHVKAFHNKQGKHRKGRQARRTRRRASTGTIVDVKKEGQSKVPSSVLQESTKPKRRKSESFLDNSLVGDTLSQKPRRRKSDACLGGLTFPHPLADNDSPTRSTDSAIMQALQAMDFSDLDDFDVNF